MGVSLWTATRESWAKPVNKRLCVPRTAAATQATVYKCCHYGQHNLITDSSYDLIFSPKLLRSRPLNLINHINAQL